MTEYSSGLPGGGVPQLGQKAQPARVRDLDQDLEVQPGVGGQAGHPRSGVGRVQPEGRRDGRGVQEETRDGGLCSLRLLHDGSKV